MKWCTDSRVHAIWYFRERLYKEPLVLAKNKESLITIEISGPKEQYFFSVICFCLSKENQSLFRKAECNLHVFKFLDKINNSVKEFNI